MSERSSDCDMIFAHACIVNSDTTYVIHIMRHLPQGMRLSSASVLH